MAFGGLMNNGMRIFLFLCFKMVSRGWGIQTQGLFYEAFLVEWSYMNFPFLFVAV